MKRMLILRFYDSPILTPFNFTPATQAIRIHAPIYASYTDTAGLIRSLANTFTAKSSTGNLIRPYLSTQGSEQKNVPVNKKLQNVAAFVNIIACTNLFHWASLDVGDL